jgi:hypothetical protein
MRILVECYPDAALLRALGVPRKQLLHFGGKYELVKNLKKRAHDVGMIDEDPGKGNPPRDMGSYQQMGSAEGLHLLTRQGSGGQRLIVVCPKLEDWLIDRAKSLEIRPEDYGLPSDPDRLHGITRYDKKEGFQRFLAELKERDNGMRLLRRWILGDKS